MYSHEKNEVKVKVAARQQTLPSDAGIVGGLILLVLISVVVLLGRPAGIM